MEGGISGFEILLCTEGSGPRTNPPSTEAQQSMCAQWIMSSGCVDNNGVCTSDGDCCSGSCDMVQHLCV